jgi:DNA-directed RNA polymerase, mitochondrial
VQRRWPLFSDSLRGFFPYPTLNPRKGQPSNTAFLATGAKDLFPNEERHLSGKLPFRHSLGDFCIGIETMDKIEKELQLERESVRLGVEEYRKTLNSRGQAEMAPGRELLARTLEPLAAEIEKFTNKSFSGTQKQACEPLAAYLKKIGVTTAAYVTAREIISTLCLDKTYQQVSANIAERMESEANYQLLEREDKERFNFLRSDLKKVDHFKLKKYRLEKAVEKAGLSIEPWPVKLKLSLGARLIAMFCDSTGLAKIATIGKGKESYQVVKGTEKALAFLERRNAECELMQPFHLPMVVKPLPWESVRDGGYLDLLLTFIKVKEKRELVQPDL